MTGRANIAGDFFPDIRHFIMEYFAQLLFPNVAKRFPRHRFRLFLFFGYLKVPRCLAGTYMYIIRKYVVWNMPYINYYWIVPLAGIRSVKFRYKAELLSEHIVKDKCVTRVSFYTSYSLLTRFLLDLKCTRNDFDQIIKKVFNF